MMKTLADYIDCNNLPFSNDKLRQAVSKVMGEIEEEEREAKRNANNVTMDNLFHRSPVTTNTQGEISNMTNESQISLDMLAITIKGFNRLKIQSKINDSHIIIQRKKTQKAIQTAIQR